jgi:amidase
VWPARALSRARALDKELARGGAVQGTFFGVPTAIKDTDPSRGAWNRMGARACYLLWSPVDGPIAARVRNGGFNIIGKTATPEFALMPVTECDIHPPCRNPWNPEFASGGSSGGAACAVASRMLPIAHASDAAGSIRIPAALCGAFGFKPSRGVLPNFYGFVDRRGLCQINSISSNVADSAAFLDVLTGHSYAPDAPAPGSLLAATRVEPGRLKIRYCVSTPVAHVETNVVSSVTETATLLRSLGHDVQEIAPIDAQVDDFLPLWQRMAANIPLPNDVLSMPITKWLRHTGRSVSAAQARTLTASLAARVLEWFGDADAFLLPTVGPHAPRIGAHKQGHEHDGEAQFRALAPLGVFTAPFNISGQPAASLPHGFSDHGVPIGVQLVGRRGYDAELYALCAQVERARPFDAFSRGTYARDASGESRTNVKRTALA